MLIKKKTKYEEHIYKWLCDKKEYIKESTYANYSYIIFNYIIPVLGKYNINKLNYDIIQEYILYLSKNKKLSNKTIKDIVVVIKGSLKEYIDKNVKYYYPKNNLIKKVNVLSKKEQNILVGYILKNINNKNIGILISLFLGVRIGEICALKWENIDFKNKILYINKTIQRIYIKDKSKNISKIIINAPKTKSSIRNIPINNELLYMLIKLKTKDNDYILTGSNKYIEPRVYRCYFDNLLNRIKLKHINFHSLRHTFATNCISIGIDYKTVSELLGHSNINTTLNLYVHPRIKEKRKCIDLVYDKFSK